LSECLIYIVGGKNITLANSNDFMNKYGYIVYR